MNILNDNAKEFWKYLASRILIFGVFVYFTFPLFWMFWTSIKPRKFAYVPGKIFFKPTIQGYIEALNSYRLPQLALNSLIVSLVASFTALVIGTLAAYALARFEYRYRKANMLFILMVRFIPPIALVLPMYLLANFTGLLDTRLILIAAYQILCITFTILIMKGFIQNIPVHYEEAAMLDGCSRIRAFFSITLPMVQNGLFATWVFLILYTWKEFPYALFLTNFKARTLPTAVQYFLATQGVRWNAAMAYGFMAVLPVLFMAIFLRRYMVQGLTFGLSK